MADVPGETRRAVRDAMRDGAFLHTCVQDIKTLLSDQDEAVEYGPEAFDEAGVVMLWDDNGRAVAGGTAYGDDTEWPSSLLPPARPDCAGT
ncbi:hypothetical protein [Kutzneria sp. NPDC052558]|uniref:hypothetical protein n=1 Tax=Kutzneria sp. NPDC052558 TaxID=3364121 RepID=UPI0037C67F49